MIQRTTLGTCLAVLLGLGGAGCGGGGGGTGTTSFLVSNLSVQDGSVWEINREIVLTFTEPVDFTTVSANTINIRSAADVPAIGVFRMRDANTVVFQPNCPTLEDYSDAGLQPGGVTYVLRVAGENSSPNTVRSITGVPLGLQQVRTFSTPASSQASVAFQDTRSGAPKPVQREQGSADTNATYLEIGADPDQRVYFELDANDQTVLSEPGFQAPLNLYSDRSSHVALVIAFNQPVNPSTINISENRLHLEYQDAAGSWHPLDTRVKLLANCTDTGAVVRLDPVGVMPPSSSVRGIVTSGFQDIIGEATTQTQSAFSLVSTKAVAFASLTPADVLSDELNESYSFGGDSPLSFQDTEVLFDSPEAEWGEGKLSAAFSFDGTGGPGGDFDWVVHAGELFFFDTTNTPIIGGPDGIPTTTVNAVNGVVDVRNLIIEGGGEIRVQGPNPMRINATGEVRIAGRLDLSGFNAKDVATLNTGNQVEIGGAGSSGGGKGGNANDNISGPTPRGGRGQGPFRQPGLGGEGGEMGVSNENNKNARRPGGGGGGRFAKDWIGTMTVSPGWSMEAKAGTNGNPKSRGAETGSTPSKGGQPGEGPFLDSSGANDFFGVRPLVTNGTLTGLVRGELAKLWAGYGGGGGGNAGQRFPNPGWNFGSDEKGGGGGGGAGGVHIKALGRIVFGSAGVILATGGKGATGENTNFLDHIGGTGGGGSGGHVILESATQVDFTNNGMRVDTPLRDFVNCGGPVLKQGSTEDVDTCGESAAYCCPSGCKVYSNGGPGGAGVVQVHVPDPTKPPSAAPNADIRVQSLALTDPRLLNAMDGVTSPPAYVMIPTFGKRSQARSKWISIGGADQKPNGSLGLVRFLFEGIDPATGRIQTLPDSSIVASLPSILTDEDLAGSSSARILPDGFTMELTGAALTTIRAGTSGPDAISNDIYLRTPSLLAGCAVRMYVVEAPSNLEDFTIASAVYEEGAAAPGDEVLRLTVTTERGRLDFFNRNPPAGMTTGFQLVPRFFQMVTNGLPDSLPKTASVRLRFQAARENSLGAPDEVNLLQDWTSDISRFNDKPAGALQFFRYEVEFDLDKDGQGITADTEAVTLDFLKLPFVF